MKNGTHINSSRERRQQVRLPESLRTELLAYPDDHFDGRTVDVSRGGALLDLPVPLQAGLPVEVALQVGTFRLEPVKAEVKRSTPAFWGHRHLVAIEFEDVNDALAEALEFQAGAEPWRPNHGGHYVKANI